MTNGLHHVSRLTIILLFAMVVQGAFAQTLPETAPATPTEAAPPPIPESLATPRATMETFLAGMEGVAEGSSGALEAAVSTLDLSDVNPLVRDEKGSELVFVLKEVIDLTREPNTRKFATRTSGAPFVFNTYESGKLSIEFTEHVGWQFSAKTVADLPGILDELLASADAEEAEARVSNLPLHLQIRRKLSGDWREATFTLERWQWLGVLIIIFVGFVIDKVVAGFLRVFARTWRRKFAEGSFRSVDDTILRPLGLMAMALVWWAGLNLLGLPANALAILLVSVKFLACLSAVWGAYRLVDLLNAFLLDRALHTESKLDDALVPLVTKTIKVFVTVLGVVFIADNLDIDVTSLLAGLGLGGLAFALAAKDVAGNLFGSVTILLDQTFHVGDWVVVGDVEGTVERIGFRSTRIRTFYNSLVSVPNSSFITANVDNMGARRFRRLSCKYGVAYDTPAERIDAFCEGLRELVRLHPYMRKDSFHIYFNNFGDSALEILIYVFWETPDWGTELRERHRFLLDSLRLAQKLGVEFAYPTQTLYMKKGDEPPLEPQSGDYVVARAESDSLADGRNAARGIVDATLGRGVVPPPVGTGPGDDDGEG